MTTPERVVEEFGPEISNQKEEGTQGSMVQWGEKLTCKQQKNLRLLVHKFRDVFNERPGRDRGIRPEIHTFKGAVVHTVSHHMHHAIHNKFQKNVRTRDSSAFM